MRKWGEFFRNMLILVMLAVAVMFSWLAGHTLRYSIPKLWHPPVQETDPHLEYGSDLEFSGIRRAVVLPGLAPKAAASARIQVWVGQGTISNECMALTYFTSLPAKCLTPDGRLVVVGVPEPNVVLIPQGK